MSRRERTLLHVAGALSNRFPSVRELAKAWMADLWRVGYYLGGRKEAGEVSYPPEQFGGRQALPIRLPSGQTLFLVLGASAEQPRADDDRRFPRAEVRGVAPKTDRAQLAALSVLEGTELTKNPASRSKRLAAIRSYLRGESDELRAEEDKLVAFAGLLVQSYRPDLDPKSEEAVELLAGTCDRVAKVAEAARQLSDYLEFGAPGSDTRVAIEDAQMDVYAAELHHIAGMTQQEVGRKLRLPLSMRDKNKYEHGKAKARIKRGENLFIRALGEDGWQHYKRSMGELYERSEKLPPNR